MKRVSAREANQRFSRLLGEVAAGEEVVITRRGEPVARLVRVDRRESHAVRQAAIDRMTARMKRGVRLGGLKATRDEMHER